ncbi:MAG: TRAP transporter large permease [Gammaproteobacteria bacterium]
MTFFLIFIVLMFMLLGAPLFAVILSATMIGFHSSDVDLSIIAVELYRMTDTQLLMTLPFFTFAGYLLSESKTSERFLRLSQVFFGWAPAGLAVISLIICAVFTALTGASGVTIVALGALLLPTLVKSGYREKFSLGLVTTSGSLGLLLPPSLPLILYGIIVQQMSGVEAFTLEELFLAGLLPCLLMILLLSAWSLYANRGRGIEKNRFSLEQAALVLKDAAWEIPLPFFILAGIFSGIFTLSEVAAITALYVLFIESAVYREIALRQLPAIIIKSMEMIGGILLILGVAMAFTNFLIDAEVPARLFEWIKSNIDSKIAFLILLNIFLLILGAILDVFSAIIIVSPLIVPTAIGYGIHPVHLGIIFLANMQIGYLTPPIGMNLFIASYRFNRPVTELYKATWPFMLILLVAVLIITYVPQLSTWPLD